MTRLDECLHISIVFVSHLLTLSHHLEHVGFRYLVLAGRLILYAETPMSGGVGTQNLTLQRRLIARHLSDPVSLARHPNDAADNLIPVLAMP